MDIPGLGGCKCVEKGARNLRPLFPKNIGLGFWMGFAIWLQLGWEEGVPAFLGMKRWDPGSDRPGDKANVELW